MRKISRLFCLLYLGLLLLPSLISAEGVFNYAVDRLRFLASDTEDLQKQVEEAGRRLRQTNLNEYFKQGYEKFNEMLKNVEPGDRQTRPLEKNRRALKHFLEALGQKKFGDDGKTLNEKTSELILKLRPDLLDTEFTADPAHCIYYFLALDPGGFVKNVKLIRGPMGVPMTLGEAYEYYYQTDPEKAAKILILLETLQKVGAPTTDEGQLEIILKAIKTNLDLINENEAQKR